MLYSLENTTEKFYLFFNFDVIFDCLRWMHNVQDTTEARSAVERVNKLLDLVKAIELVSDELLEGQLT